MSEKITLLQEEFENEKTGEKVSGVTVIIDGKLRQIMDILIDKNTNYNSYPEIIQAALFSGIEKMMKEM